MILQALGPRKKGRVGRGPSHVCVQCILTCFSSRLDLAASATIFKIALVGRPGQRAIPLPPRDASR